jgi:hypothetical protein
MGTGQLESIDLLSQLLNVTNVARRHDRHQRTSEQ